MAASTNRKAGTAVSSALRYDRFTILVMAIAAPLMISSTAVQSFGVPRPTLLSIPFTLYMIVALRGRISAPILGFAAAYLLAFTPGTIVAGLADNIKVLAVFQTLSALITFVVAGTYFGTWLANCPPNKQKRQLLILLSVYLVWSVVEMADYEQIAHYRTIFYNTTLADTQGAVLLNRELRLYGGRPTGFFSETSHFARFLALIIATYMMVTRNSLMSLAALGCFLFLTRSVSFLFAAPAMVASVLFASRGLLHQARLRRMGVGLIVTVFAIVVIVPLTIYLQGERIENAFETTKSGVGIASEDGSLNARLIFPLNYALLRNESPLLGMGITPQDKVQNDVLETEQIVYRWQVSEDYMEGISASVVMLVGLGLVGFILCLILMFWFVGIRGLTMFVSYFLANLISSGFNTVVSLVPSAMLLALILHASSRPTAQR